MSRCHTLRIVTALPIVLLALACSDGELESSETANPQALNSGSGPSADGLAQPRAREAGCQHEAGQRGHQRMHGHHRGPTRLLGVALRQLELSNDQRQAIIDLETSLKPAAEAGTKRTSAREVFANAFATGTLDESALDQAMTQNERLLSERREREARALNQLHGLLNPEQRVQLSTAMQQRRQHPGKPSKAKLGKGGSEDQSPKQWAFKARAGHQQLGMLRHVALSDSQRAQLAQAMPQPNPQAFAEQRQAHQRQHEQVLEAFKSADFDAATLLTQPRAPHLEQRAQFVRAALSVLDADQKAQVAKQLRAAPKPGKQRGKRHWQEDQSWGEGN